LRQRAWVLSAAFVLAHCRHDRPPQVDLASKRPIVAVALVRDAVGASANAVAPDWAKA
jgi:hypothetical protein